jgi:hypothetical protein
LIRITRAQKWPRPAAPNPQPSDDQAITTCGGDAREAVRALIVANHFLETELAKLQAAVSTGYAGGKLLRRDRKDCD